MSDQLNEEIKFDVLGDVLDTMRFRGSMFFRSDLAAPWGMSLPPAGIPCFHIVLSGTCFAGTDNTNAVKVVQTGIIMFPSGNSHWIADQPGRKLIPSVRAREACALGNPFFQEGGITNSLMCGLVHFDQEAPHPIFDALPPILHFPKFKLSEPIWMTITLIDARIRQTQDLGGSIVDRLTEVLILQLLNHYVNENKDAAGFFAALRDQRVHRALKLIHKEPSFDWSLSSLGERVGMSRATLTRHFKEHVGVAPMTYIKNWRLMKAHNLIKHTSTSLDRIAESIGFASASSLSKAFQRHYDCTPSALRRASNTS